MNCDDYKITIPYPNRPNKPFLAGNHSSKEASDYANALAKWEDDMVAHRMQLAAYREAQVKLDEHFKQDVLKEFGLEGHPKAKQVWDLAWEEGCSMGYEGVANRVERLAELIK